jgi:hypothetical protein
MALGLAFGGADTASAHNPGFGGPGYFMGPGMMGPGYGMMDPGYGMMGGGYGMMGPGYGMMSPGCATPGAGYGMMAPGYGMMGPGSGMMGPGSGMMGPGYGMMGPGSGMMGPGYGMMGPLFGEPSRPGADLSADDVRGTLERWLTWQGNPRLKVGDVKEESADVIVADVVTQDGSLVDRFKVDRHSGLMQRAP